MTKIMLTIFLAIGLICKTDAAGVTYDYKENGADWPLKYPECGKKNQSPIDLKTDWYVISADKDNF